MDCRHLSKSASIPEDRDPSLLLSAPFALSMGPPPVTQRHKRLQNPQVGGGPSSLGEVGPPPAKPVHILSLRGQNSSALTSFSSPLKVTRSASSSGTPTAHFSSRTWPITTRHCHVSSHRDTGSIPVPRTEPGTSWALSKPLGERVMGEASVSPSRKGEVHSRWSSGSLPHPSPTRSVSLGAERTKKAGNGGDGRRSEWRAGRGDNQGIP